MFLFKHFRYATAFGEDGSWMGIFNYGKNGFSKQPVDHMFGVLDRLAQNDIGFEGMNSRTCQGARFAVEYLLEHELKFCKTYKNAGRNYFGFFWQSTVSHDVINYDPRIDLIYRDHLEYLKRLNTLEDTFLFVISDHGIRWGGILNTLQGRLEERLPFFFVVPPKSFKQEHPEALSNLEKNSKRLTTPFDFHETLKSIADEDFSTNLIDIRRGYSLFKAVPLNRTCNNSGEDNL